MSTSQPIESFGRYYAAQADAAVQAARLLDAQAVEITDPDVRALTVSAADRHRAEAALWSQLADEISTYLTTTGADEELPL